MYKQQSTFLRLENGVCKICVIEEIRRQIRIIYQCVLNCRDLSLSRMCRPIVMRTE